MDRFEEYLKNRIKGLEDVIKLCKKRNKIISLKHYENRWQVLNEVLSEYNYIENEKSK